MHAISKQQMLVRILPAVEHNMRILFWDGGAHFLSSHVLQSHTMSSADFSGLTDFSGAMIHALEHLNNIHVVIRCSLIQQCICSIFIRYFD